MRWKPNQPKATLTKTRPDQIRSNHTPRPDKDKKITKKNETKYKRKEEKRKGGEN
jgi:hypothetical protein